MMTDLIGPNGETVEGDSIRAKLSRQAQDAVDAKMAEWFGRESEFGAYAPEDVRELGRHVV